MATISKHTAIARIISDLIKADNIIDEQEIKFLAKLESVYGIKQKDLVQSQLVTFSDSVKLLRDIMTQSEKKVFLNRLKEMSLIDGSCCTQEALLLVALEYCFNENYESHSELLYCESSSIIGDNERYAIYIESEPDAEINEELQQKSVFRNIQNAFRLNGFDFIYVPYIVNEFKRKDKDYIKNVIRYMSPTCKCEQIDEVYNRVCGIDTCAFTNEILYKRMGVDVMNTEPAQLINIGSSLVPYCGDKEGNKVYTEFLRINIVNGLQDDLTQFVDNFSKYISEGVQITPTITVNRLKYFGFYKALFDLMLHTKAKSDIVINPNISKKAIYFKDINEYLNVRQNEKALYILMLKESICNKVDKGLLYAPSEKKKASLERAYREIYGRFTSTELQTDYVTGIAQSVSHIRKAISELRNLKDVDSYMPKKIATDGVYRIEIDSPNVYVYDYKTQSEVPITEFEFD